MQLSTGKLWILVLSIALPAGLTLWISNHILGSVFGIATVSLLRWVSSLLVPILSTYWGLKRNSLSNSGAIAGFFVGFVITLSNCAFLSCLVIFFFSSSKATKFRSHLKIKFEENFSEGGRRNWVQVLCNGIIATMIALIYISECGCQEMVLDFIDTYKCSMLSYGFIGAFSCCNGDTWASELGPVLKFGKPVLLTTLKPVPKGTNGGISLAGLASSFLGGSAVGLAYFIILHLSIQSSIMGSAPPQWPVIFISGLGGFFGSLIDSFLGATLQYSGINKEGVIMEHPGPGIIHISGRHILDNHSINLLSSGITACLLPFVALYTTTL